MSLTPSWPGYAYPVLTYPGDPITQANTGIGLSGWTFEVVVGGVTYACPDWRGIQLSWDMSEVGTFRGDYPRIGINSDRIANDTIVVSKFNGVEPFDGRWRLIAGQGDDIDEDTMQQFIGRSLMDIFRRVLVRPIGNRTAIKFATAVTPGFLMRILFQEAQSRGAMTGITWTFTDTLDSAGQPWAKSLNNVSFNVGTKYIDILRYLVDNMFMESRFDGTQFTSYNFDTMGIDHMHDNPVPVVLTAGKDYEELPKKWSTENKINYSITFGDEDSFAEALDNTIPVGPFGIEEAAQQQGGTKDAAMLTALNTAALEKVKLMREQLTRKMVVRSTTPVPAVDFKVGDWITEFSPTDNLYQMAASNYRVRTIVIDVDEAGTVSKAALTLNDKFLEQAIKLSRWVEGITGGVGTTNGTPSPSTPALTDTTIPNAPTGLGFASEVYTTTEGQTLAVLSVSWNAPTLNTDGTILSDFGTYEINWKRNGAVTWQVATVTSGFFAIAGLVPGAQYLVRVRCLDTASPPHASGWLGGTGGSLSPALASDTTAPSVPSAPLASSARGVIIASHDFKSASATPLEADTLMVEIHISQTSNFTPVSGTLHSALLKAGSVTIAGLPQNGNPWYLRAVAVDRSGNRSAPSTQTAQTLNRIQGPDLLANTVGTNEMVAGSVTTDIIKLGVLRTNPIANPGFEDTFEMTLFGPGPKGVQGDVNQWRNNNTAFGVAFQKAGGTRSGVARCSIGVLPGGSTSDVARLYSNSFAVKAGSQYRISWSALATGSGAVAAGTAYQVVAYFGSAIDSVGATATYTQVLGTYTATYVNEATITTDSYEAMSEDMVIPGGQTELYCSLQFLVNGVPADSFVSIDDVACIEAGIGGATEITAAGMRLFDNDGTEVVAFMSNRPNYITVQRGGSTVASISDQGAIAGTSVSSDGDMTVGGVPLVGLQGNSDIPVDYMPDSTDRDYTANPRGIIESYSKGNVQWFGFTVGASPATAPGNGWMKLFDVGFDLEPGRQYAVNVSPFLINGVASGQPVGLILRSTTDGTMPDENSFIFARCYSTIGTNGFASVQISDRLVNGGASVQSQIRILGMVYALSASQVAKPFPGDYVLVSIKDLGLTKQAQGRVLNLVSAGGTGGTGTTPTTPAPKPYVKTYTSNGWATYRSKNGLLRGSSSSPGDTNSKIYQGYSSSGSYNGDQRGLWTFPSITGDVGSGTITRIRLTITWNWWYNNNGGSALIKAHNYASGGWPTGSLPSFTTVKTQSFGSKSGTMVVDVPSSLFSAFKAGTLKGFGIGPAGSTSATFYGYASSVAKMEVSYTK